MGWGRPKFWGILGTKSPKILKYRGGDGDSILGEFGLTSTDVSNTRMHCRAQSNFVVIINDLTQNMFTYSETHDLSNPDLWDSPYLRNKFLLTNFH